MADFKRHIEAVAQQSEVVRDGKGNVVSSFFINRMYGGGMEIIPYPPLSTKEFFDELNGTLETSIHEMRAVHKGGASFLNFVKLVMARLHLGDFSAMSGDEIKLRAREIRENLSSAVATGSVVPSSAAKYGATFRVEDNQKLLILDGSTPVTVDHQDIIDETPHFEEIVGRYKEIDEKVADKIMAMLDGVDDDGLVLGTMESLKFLWQIFNANVPRNGDNFKKQRVIFQLFLDVVYRRRERRVKSFVEGNMSKFDGKNKSMEMLMNFATLRLGHVQRTMELCTEECDECFYPCLLCHDHQEREDWPNVHSCFQDDHNCQGVCTYCTRDGVDESNNIGPNPCAKRCGHSLGHKCSSEEHLCLKPCGLSAFVGCKQRCNLLVEHEDSCRCEATAHFCAEKCAVDICEETCAMAYNRKHEDHQCGRQMCPHRCTVKCWDPHQEAVRQCGRPCISTDHLHAVKMAKGECADEIHHCGQPHRCPEICGDQGMCGMNTQRHSTGINAWKKHCCHLIPAGKVKCGAAKHECSEEKIVHSCLGRCKECGKYCGLIFEHSKEHWFQCGHKGQ